MHVLEAIEILEDFRAGANPHSRTAEALQLAIVALGTTCTHCSFVLSAAVERSERRAREQLSLAEIDDEHT